MDASDFFMETDLLDLGFADELDFGDLGLEMAESELIECEP